ncbi:hypothetical protein AAIK02_000285 [Salmonella enterica]|nr:hypothetical protein [Salmonella enterica subsp. houtenae]
MAQIREMLDQSQEAQTKEQLQFLINAAQGKLNEQKEKAARDERTDINLIHR